MAQVIAIPLTTLLAGNDLISPAEPIGTFTSFLFSIDRNVGATPLDTLAGDTIEMHIEYSFDGGITFLWGDNQTIGGGIVRNRSGVEILISAWGSTFPDGADHVRARVHSIQNCTVSGSLTLN